VGLFKNGLFKNVTKALLMEYNMSEHACNRLLQDAHVLSLIKRKSSNQK